MLLSAPIAVFGAFAGLYLRRFDFDVYGQIGLIILIDLAAKNAILTVEFARDEMAKGRDVIDAVVEGAKLRLRPILMTSLAFILGCLPPMMASGSGSAGSQILGTVMVTGSAGGRTDRMMSSRVATRTESAIRESGTMRASVTAPTMTETIAIDRSAPSRPRTARVRSPERPGAACSRLVAMSARHIMILKERKRLLVGFFVDAHLQAGNERHDSLAARFQDELIFGSQ